MFYIYTPCFIHIYIYNYMHNIPYKQEEASIASPFWDKRVKSMEVRTGVLGWCFADNHLLSPALTPTMKSPTTNKSKNTCCLTPNHKPSFVRGYTRWALGEWRIPAGVEGSHPKVMELKQTVIPAWDDGHKPGWDLGTAGATCKKFAFMARTLGLRRPGREHHLFKGKLQPAFVL